MKIKRIVINGFGSLFDYDSGPLADGITIFEGKNEAGKSTIMSFIRAVLLGFPAGKGKEGKYEKYEPLSGGPYGGMLILEDDQGKEYRIVRSKATGKSRGQVTVYLPDGTQEGEAFLQRLIGGISPVLFKQIFAFSLTELQQMDFLESKEINSYIYSAGMGAGISIMEVDKKLEGAMNALFKPRAVSPRINRYAARLKELDKEIARLQQQVSRYNRLLEEEKEIEHAMGLGEQEGENLRQKHHELEMMAKGRESWEALCELRIHLQHLPETGDFPVEGLERLEQMLAEKRRVEILLKQKEEKRSRLQEELKKIEVNLALLNEKNAVDNLLRQAGKLKECQERLAENRMVIEQCEESLQLLLRQLAGSWRQEDFLHFDISLARREEVRAFRDRIQEEENQLLRVESQQEKLKKDWQKQKGMLTALEQEGEISSIPELEKNLLAREEALKELERIRQAIDRLQREEAHFLERKIELQEQLKEQTAKNKSLRQVIFLIFVFGVFISIIIGFQNFWLGLLTGMFTMFLVFLLIRQYKGQKGERIKAKLRDLQSQLEKLLDEQEQSHSQLQMLMEKLGYPSFSYAALARVEEEMKEMRRELERLHRLKERINELSHQLSLLEEEYRSLENDKQTEKKAARQWQEWLAQRNLDPSLSPEGVMDLFRLVERGQDIFYRFCQAREEYKADEQFIHDFSRQVQSLFVKGNVEGYTSEDVLSSFYYLHKKIAEEEKKSHHRKQLEKELASLEEELREIQVTYQSLQQQEQELYALAGANEEEEFRQLGMMHRQRNQLLQEIQRRERELLVLAGTEEKKEMLEKALQTYDSFTIEEELQQVIGKRKELQHRLNQLREKKGQIREQITRMEREGTLSRLLQEREEILTEIRREGKKWGVYAICRHLLQEAREKYERERQPGVLREASKYFAKITGNKYSRIVAPIGSEHIYAVGEKGMQMEPGYLSRGTREQLYLSMRFALAREFSRQVSLPLVMDDILVNFDLVRLQKTVEVLKEMAQHHQILFFTCHPYISKILLEEMEGSRLVQIGDPIINYNENVLF